MEEASGALKKKLRRRMRGIKLGKNLYLYDVRLCATEKSESALGLIVESQSFFNFLPLDKGYRF